MCSRTASCPCATFEIEPCVESGYLACGRRRPRLQARLEEAPTTNPYLDSNDSEHRALAGRAGPRLMHALPNASRDDRRARLVEKERGIQQAHVALFE